MTAASASPQAPAYCVNSSGDSLAIETERFMSRSCAVCRAFRAL
jgi:hypothetical protein